MKLRMKLCLAALFLCFAAFPLFAQGNLKVESVPAPTTSEVPQPLLETLDAQGARVVGEQGTICEIWLRKDLTLGAPAGGLGDVLYGQLGAGNLVGVLHFPGQGADFRGHPVKAGYYALRYALIPQDGAHMGVFPTRDALHLTPVATDTELGQALKYDDMVKLGQQVSGVPHPAFLVMSAVQEGGAFPSVVKDDEGHWNVQLKVQGKNGELPIGITVVGKWAGE